MPARPASLRCVRGLLQEWLARNGWPGDAGQDLVLAVNEALTNAVEHAYPAVTPNPGVHINAGIEWSAATGPGGNRRARITILDRGRWQPFLVPHGDQLQRGWGLPLMRMLASEVHINTGEDRGTCVTVLSHPVAGRPGSGR